MGYNISETSYFSPFDLRIFFSYIVGNMFNRFADKFKVS